MRALAVFCAIASFAIARADELKWTISFSGANSGNCKYEGKPDGTFRAETQFAVAGITAKSVLTGKFENGKLVGYVLDSEQAGKQAKITFGGGKVKVEQAGKTTESDFKGEYAGACANIHPQLFSNLLMAFDESKGVKQTIPTLFTDAAAVLPFEVTMNPPVTYTGPKGSEILKSFNVKVTIVDCTILLNDKGVVVGVDVPSQQFRIELEGHEGAFLDPVAKYKELSQPTFKAKWEKAVKIPMRDGVKTTADIVRPDGEGKFPIVLIRTPYGRAAAGIQGEWWAKRGYAQVIQDVRGMGDSDGAWEPFLNERKDGYDTIDWISKQPWCDGNVGMIGGSYLGFVQWCAAVESHPALKCIIPQVSPPDLFFNIPYDYGTFFLYGAVWWGYIVRGKSADFSGIGGTLPHPDKLTTLPLSKVDDAVLGVDVPIYDKWLEMDRASAFARSNFLVDMKKVTLPALHISGWWDGDGIGTKRNWERMKQLGRKNQWLIYGPWSHAFNTTRSFGDVDYGPDAILELDSLYLRWFDTWLKRRDVGMEKVPKVRVFLSGANRWLELPDWPDSSWQEKTLYLSADSPANGPSSRGSLADRPAEKQEPTRYTYNPAEAYVPDSLLKGADPSASIAYKIEKYQNDVLVYKTSTLSAPMAIAGPISVELHFSTSAKDTDFYAMLVDEDEKGVMRPIGLPGKISGRYLSGFDNPKPLTPGRTYRVRIDLWDTAHEFEKGHKMVLVITSDMFPLYARNLGTGEPIKDATRMVAASNAIYHDATRPSAIRFRVIKKQAP